MNSVYNTLCISKQAYHGYRRRQQTKQEEQAYLLQIIQRLRDDHPTMGCRDMYYKLLPQSLGRDAFEAFCRENSLMSKRSKNPRRTTDSNGVIRFDNLMDGLLLTRTDQAWVSDITYFEVDGKFYYLTFIIDAFSRRILGYSVSNRLLTNHTTLPALQMALSVRKHKNYKDLIFHSDGGGQYYAASFLALTAKHQIQNSMCSHAWENGKAERINGVIKNNYLIHRPIDSFKQLKKEVDRSVKLYNEQKPHVSLNRMTPIQFEKQYLYYEKQTDAEKSTTEYETLSPEGITALRAVEKQTSASNITIEYKCLTS